MIVESNNNTVDVHNAGLTDEERKIFYNVTKIDEKPVLVTSRVLLGEDEKIPYGEFVQRIDSLSQDSQGLYVALEFSDWSSSKVLIANGLRGLTDHESEVFVSAENKIREARKKKDAFLMKQEKQRNKQKYNWLRKRYG